MLGAHLEGPVLVGYDGSRNAGAALGWAQRTASLRESPVRLVYVYEWSSPASPAPPEATWPDRSARRETQAAVDEALARARSQHPEVTIEGTVIDGLVVPILRKLSERTQLLVLGDRGLGGFPGLLAGSVAADLATCAHCPTVVVRGCAPPSHPVVVGIDDSADSDTVVGLAFEQAAVRGVDLVALRAGEPPPVPHRADAASPVYDAAGHLSTQRRLVEQLLRGWPERFPQVRVVTEVASGGAAEALISASESAQLLIVGTHGRHGVRDVPLGSTARCLIEHAHCPVMIVRDGDQRPREIAALAGQASR